MLLSRFASDDPVLIDATTGRGVTRRDIDSRASVLETAAGRRDPHTGELQTGNPLVFLIAETTVAAITDIHALLAVGLPVALLDSKADPDQTAELIARYQPELVIADENWTSAPGYRLTSERTWRPNQPARQSLAPAHPDLAVLLSTSGSTGSPKFVRLSQTNILTNARQIAASLRLTAADRGVTALPVHYSFGLSVLTSHAFVGSPVVVTSGSVIEPGFWADLGSFEVTLLPGVPQTYQMLNRLRFAEKYLPQAPHLRGLMQAGGKLVPELIAGCAAAMADRGGEFFVMYGQTEASPRMACLPPHRLADKLGSVGQALDDGHLEARATDGSVLPPGEVGEIHYRGGNVMMGYAQTRDDVALDDVQGDTLATGDLGYVDDEGFLFLTGRAKRIAKVAGQRVSLDEFEALAARVGIADAVAVEAPAGTITLVTTEPDNGPPTTALKQLARLTRLPPKSIRVHHVDAIGLLSNGKVDYQGLQAALSGLS